MSPNAITGEIVDGRYQIVRIIGRGAMADVYEAHDLKGQRSVALKILRLSVAKSPESLQRFQREARAQEMLEHRNVARLYGGGATKKGEPYLVVELLRGRSLRTVVRKEGRVSLVRAASYCWQALQGLAAIHTMGITHRDLKPANLMLEPSPGPVERVVLIDFGFADIEGGHRLTQQGHVVGSLSYLAPERLKGLPGDERSDLYAVGIILFELLAGRPPFVANDDFELINLHLDQAPHLPGELSTSLPPSVQSVLMQSLAKDPNDRAQSATAMANQLEAAMRDVK